MGEVCPQDTTCVCRSKAFSLFLLPIPILGAMGRDWDKLLAYETLKVVMIEDKILGGLHWFLTLVIAGYVGCYVFLYDKGYLNYEDVLGVVRMAVQSPSAYNMTDDLYCTNSGLTDPAVNPRKCEVWSKYTLSATEDLSKSFFLATGVEYTTMTRDCSEFYDPILEYRTCDNPWTVNESSHLKTFITEVEKFTVTVTHNAFGPQHAKSESPDSFYFKGNSITMDGSFVSSDLSTEPLPIGVADTFSLGTLLASVNNVPAVSLDSVCTDHTCKGNPSSTFRALGLVLIMEIEYSNDYGIVSPNPMRYKVSVLRLPDAVHSITSLVNVVEGAQQQRTVQTISGIRIDIVQTGQVGKLNFATILNVGVGSLMLLKIAVVLVDLVATRVLKNRKAYTTMKYHRVAHSQVELRKQNIRSSDPFKHALLDEPY